MHYRDPDESPFSGKSFVEEEREVLFVEAGSLTGSARQRPPIKVENVGHSFGIPINRGLEGGGGTMLRNGFARR
jgi:hypothetical protein